MNEQQALQQLREYLRERGFKSADFSDERLSNMAIERSGSIEQYLVDSKKLHEDIQTIRSEDLDKDWSGDDPTGKWTSPIPFRIIENS